MGLYKRKSYSGIFVDFNKQSCLVRSSYVVKTFFNFAQQKIFKPRFKLNQPLVN